jgi:hypothetical protein
MSTRGQLDTEYLTRMIMAHVPDAGLMTWDEAASLAVERNIQAADELIDSVESVLNLEAAVKAANENLDAYFRGCSDLWVVGDFIGFKN